MTRRGSTEATDMSQDPLGDSYASLIKRLSKVEAVTPRLEKVLRCTFYMGAKTMLKTAQHALHVHRSRGPLDAEDLLLGVSRRITAEEARLTAEIRGPKG